jgi:hypothetical protein
MVEEMVAACPHCALANSRKQAKSEFMFGWNLDSPFCNVHVDVWSACDVAGDGNKKYQLKSMCDMTQFVISTPAIGITAHELSTVFMQEVLVKVGFCIMVVVYDGNNFKGLFKEMCDIIKLRLHVIAKGNHQALCVDPFHAFLNKFVTITVNDRNIIEGVYVEASAVAAYAWNSSPNDGTDIVRSMPVVGTEFRFRFDFDYVPSPTMSENKAAKVHE